MIVLTFGVHNGKDIEDVPSGYLRKLCQPARYIAKQCNQQYNVDFLNAIKVELADRDEKGCHF